MIDGDVCLAEPAGAHLSDLDYFILTRYDPLLQIVKQLTDRVQDVEDAVASAQPGGQDVARLCKLEADVAKLAADRSVRQVEATFAHFADKLSSLETTVAELRTGHGVHEELLSQAGATRTDMARRLGSLEERLPLQVAGREAEQGTGQRARCREVAEVALNAPDCGSSALAVTGPDDDLNGFDGRPGRRPLVRAKAAFNPDNDPSLFDGRQGQRPPPAAVYDPDDDPCTVDGRPGKRLPLAAASDPDGYRHAFGGGRAPGQQRPPAVTFDLDNCGFNSRPGQKRQSAAAFNPNVEPLEIDSQPGQRLLQVGGSGRRSVSSDSSASGSEVWLATTRLQRPAPKEEIHEGADLSAPWLFRVGASVATFMVQSTLDFDNRGTVTIELDCRRWAAEADMWRETASSLLRANSPGFGHLASQVALGAEHDTATKALARACLSEVLIMVRSVPGRDDLRAAESSSAGSAAKNPALGSPAQNRLRCIAQLALEVQSQWDAVSESTPVEKLGRIVVVLAGDGIGTSLKAGSMKLPIEPLSIDHSYQSF